MTASLFHRATLAALAALLFATPAAHAASFGFEEGAIADGVAVSTQFAAQGLTLTAGGTNRAPFLPKMRVSMNEAHNLTSRALNISASGLEFPVPDLSGSFSTSRTTLSLWVRNVSGGSGLNSTRMRLYAFRTDGTVAATSAVADLPDNGLYRSISVASAATDIATFRLQEEAGSDPGMDVRVDDIVVDDPATPPAPDFSLSTPVTGTVVVGQGSSNSAPIEIDRRNGSTGPIAFSVQGLPGNVFATFSPNPATGGTSATTMTLVHTTQSPSGFDAAPREITVVGTPQDAAAGSGPRPVTLRIQRRPPYVLVPEEEFTDRLALPRCGPAVRRTYRLVRTPGFTEPVDLTQQANPGINTGVASVITPARLEGSADRFTVDWSRLDTPYAGSGPAFIEGRSATTQRQDVVEPLDLPPGGIVSARSLHHGEERGITPQGNQPGEHIHINGSGFCPGSKVTFGNAAATVDPTVLASNFVQATVPREAVDGPVKVTSPGGVVFTSPRPLDIEGYRETHGFSFVNDEAWTGGSIDDWEELFGREQIYMSVDPCALVGGDCAITTDVPRWGFGYFQAFANLGLRSANGRCVGFAIASRRFAFGQESMDRYAAPGTSPRTIRELPRTDALEHYLDIQHQAQLSAEFLREYLGERLEGDFGQVGTGGLRRSLLEDFRQGRRPVLTMARGGGGHAVVAYDAIDMPGGGLDVLVYDPNMPYSDEENTSAPAHRDRMASSRLSFAANGHWVFFNPMSGGATWSGGLGDIATVSAEADVPVHPTYPVSAEGIVTMVFGSGTGAPAAGAGAARAAAPRALPSAEADAPAPQFGYVMSSKTAQRFSLDSGDGGKQELSFFGSGGLATVTTTGGDGSITIDPAARGLHLSTPGRGTFDANLFREAAGGATRGARLQTSATTGAAEAMRFEGDQLVVTHDGPATTARLELSVAGGDALPGRLTTGAMRLERGDRVSVRPDWTRLGTGPVTAVVRSGGRTRKVRLRSSGRPSARITKLRVRATTVRSKSAVRVTTDARLAGPAARSTAVTFGVVVRRGSKVVGTSSLSRSAEQARQTVIDVPVRGKTKGLSVSVSAVAVGTAPLPVASSKTARGRVQPG